MGMINHFETIDFREVQPFKTSYPEFRKVISIFTTPDLTQVNIKELRSAQKNRSTLFWSICAESRTKSPRPFLSSQTRIGKTWSFTAVPSPPGSGTRRMTAIQVQGRAGFSSTYRYFGEDLSKKTTLLPTLPNE